MFMYLMSDGKMFNLAGFRERTNDTEVRVREMMFADDTVFATHAEEDLQRLIYLF
ncbi:hypothetical protein DPMN_113606 [Dreissena polymorpha]|uniref:Uncharacterized protein n=1 Tax=Dreissena polymorpha TaxID=45954 RepID=A0A9D4KIZ6_DREPO|nr:hypothetical protein DPMN_113606 [Dreissena polymorpha]